DEAFFVFYGDDIIKDKSLNFISGSHFPEQGKNHKIFDEQPLHIEIKGEDGFFYISMNGEEVSRFAKEKVMGDLKMIEYESRRIKLTLNDFTVSTIGGALNYDMLSEVK
ncbi:MAG: hypothetical protein KI786_08975, partial [Mameliella sp.]|nr:hypothetical protein [Phaeodactylibacter sp.]